MRTWSAENIAELFKEHCLFRMVDSDFQAQPTTVKLAAVEHHVWGEVLMLLAGDVSTADLTICQEQARLVAGTTSALPAALALCYAVSVNVDKLVIMSDGDHVTPMEAWRWSFRLQESHNNQHQT
jgi:hypothetical protein